MGGVIDLVSDKESPYALSVFTFSDVVTKYSSFITYIFGVLLALKTHMCTSRFNDI